MTKRWYVSAVLVLGTAMVVTPVTVRSGAAPALHTATLMQHKGASNIQQASNWSGYDETSSKSTYSSVGGSWTVPRVTSTSGNSYSASWIGIDGAKNLHLIQTGTESDWTGGSAHYDAWWEILPAPETVIPRLIVTPGNAMTASITKGSSKWTITITDTTTGQSFSIHKSYGGPAESIEWIVERPQVGGHLATLAKYGKVTFSTATVNGANPAFQASDEIEMLNNAGTKVISTPGAPSSARNAFTVAYGSKAPPPPSG